MEWRKIKTIILLMLVGVNVFLLALVGLRESQSARYAEETRQAAVAVLERSGITFGLERVPADLELIPLTVTRDRESEAAVAEALLGPVTELGESEVRPRYVGEGGSAEFSMNGDFTILPKAGTWSRESGESYESASAACLARIGFEGVFQSMLEQEDQTVLTYCQSWAGATVFSCRVELFWQGDSLVRVEGQRLAGTAVETAAGQPLSTVDVLMRFLAGVSEGEYICRSIDAMEAGYLLSGIARPVQLVPVWRITTDTRVFYVDAYTGALSTVS